MRFRVPNALTIAAVTVVVATASLGVSSAKAATFTVTGISDNGGACAGTICPSLRVAISAANALGGPDQIDLQPGTFRIELGSGPFGSSTPDDANVNGDLDVTGPLTIKGSGAALTNILGALPSGEGERDIHVIGGSSLTLTDLTVSGGRGGMNESFGIGGGIFAEGTLTTERVVIRDNTVQGHASFGDGAGIAVYGRLVMRDSAILSNTAFSGGYGGGIYIDGSASSDLTNVTISGNKAEYRGAGIESNSTGIGLLSFVTIVGNEMTIPTGRGGGVGTAGGLSLRNSILDGNSGSTGVANCNETPQSFGGNVVDPACGLNDATSVATLDPKLALLTGSPIPVFEPLADSPAIDRAVAPCAANDARGVTRPQGAACDSGAAERPDVTAPVGEALLFSPRSFAAMSTGASIVRKHAKRGSKAAYRLSEAATVTFTVERATKGRKVGNTCKKQTRKNRRRKLCTFYTTVKGSFTHAAQPGANGFAFTGRIANKALKRGSYRLVGVPRDAAGNIGNAFRAKFTIVRR